MIEKSGKFTALDGTEFPYTDFRESQGGGGRAKAHDRRILATREKQKGQPLTIRESLEPAAQRKHSPATPAEAGKTTSRDARNQTPLSLSRPCRAADARRRIGETDIPWRCTWRRLAPANKGGSTGKGLAIIALTPAFEQVIPFHSFLPFRKFR